MSKQFKVEVDPVITNVFSRNVLWTWKAFRKIVWRNRKSKGLFFWTGKSWSYLEAKSEAWESTYYKKPMQMKKLKDFREGNEGKKDRLSAVTGEVNSGGEVAVIPLK